MLTMTHQPGILRFGDLGGARPQSNNISGIYNRCHLRFRSQRTVLERIIDRAKVMDCVTDVDKQAIAKTGELAESMISSEFGELHKVINSAMADIRVVVDTGKYSAETMKLLQTCMLAAMEIQNVGNEFSATLSASVRLSNSKKEQTESTWSDGGDVRVCDICEEKISVEVYDEHRVACIASYRNESKITLVDERIMKLNEALKSAYLRTEWPGTGLDARSRTFPALHLMVLLRRALHMDPHISDSIDELIAIKAIVDVLTFSHLSEYLTAAKVLIADKIRSSCALDLALSTLQRTRMEPGEARSARSMISDFEFVKRISRGAYGTVFLARKMGTIEMVAIKASPKAELQRKNQVCRVTTERDILVHFGNPYIVKFLCSAIGERNLYLVMEFVPGGDLYSLLQNVGSIDEKGAKVYTLQTLLALRYLRQNGIIHRDIKPDNLLIAADGSLKLADFGLSYSGAVEQRKTSDDGGEDGLAQAKSLVGTPDYVAPEIIMNTAHSFTVDYWSLGAMIYELVYGVAPFHAENENETRMRIMLGKVHFNGEQSPEFEDLVRKLLTIDPAKRLGAGSIDEIFQHPWFAGLNPNLLLPPFVPNLDSDVDTDYFEQRYAFNDDEDAAVLADIAHPESNSDSDSGAFVRPRSPSEGQVKRMSISRSVTNQIMTVPMVAECRDEQGGSLDETTS